MKGKPIFTRITSMLLLATTFCCVTASAYELEAPPQALKGSDGKDYVASSLLDQDSPTVFRASVWANTEDGTRVIPGSIGCKAILCDADRTEHILAVSQWSYNTYNDSLHYAVTDATYSNGPVCARGFVNVGRGDVYITPSPAAGGNGFMLTRATVESHRYPVTAAGETYGSLLSMDVTHEIPDLLSAENEDGVVGYLRSQDILGEPKEQTRMVDPDGRVSIPMYDLQGEVVDSFPLCEAKRCDLSSCKTVEEAKALVGAMGSAQAMISSSGKGGYQVTEKGETYGSLLDMDATPVLADLFSAENDDGLVGYIRSVDFLGKTPTKTRVYQPDGTISIPMYDLQGNVIGSFTLKPSKNVDLRSCKTVEQAKDFVGTIGRSEF